MRRPRPSDGKRESGLIDENQYEDGWIWRPPSPWCGRSDDPDDPQARRWHQVVSCGKDFPRPRSVSGLKEIWFIGVPCHIGVVRNLGRGGAAAAPGQIRRAMANLPCLFDDKIRLIDGGDILPVDDDLEGLSEGLAGLVESVVAGGGFPIVLGGGHETAFGCFEGLRRGLRALGKNDPPAIVNFDAHFDLRPYSVDEGLHSGNMFRRIAGSSREREESFRYRVIGIQRSSNTPALFRLADELGVRYHTALEISGESIETLRAKTEVWTGDAPDLFVSLCCDVIAAAHAPGVSAPQPFGLDPECVLEMMRILARSRKAVGLNVAEVSPRFDHDNRTAHLAAVLLFAWINALAGVSYDAESSFGPG